MLTIHTWLSPFFDLCSGTQARQQLTVIAGNSPNEVKQMKNIVTCFTKEEKEHIKELCDFTPTEETLFDLRKKEKSLEECAEIMHVSTKTAGRINVRMQKKILKVTNCHF